jgi:1-acyl-sn-glycerol-3-phosphate acyltransferase
MFAEGTRGKERGRLGPFKRGAFRVAVATGVPIVPVVISPLKPQTDLRARRLTPHDVVIQVLDPVFAAGSTHEDENRLGNEVWNRMQRCLETY